MTMILIDEALCADAKPANRPSTIVAAMVKPRKDFFP
jgi:hypothetical protein